MSTWTIREGQDRYDVLRDGRVNYHTPTRRHAAWIVRVYAEPGDSVQTVQTFETFKAEFDKGGIEKTRRQ